MFSKILDALLVPLLLFFAFFAMGACLAFPDADLPVKSEVGKGFAGVFSLLLYLAVRLPDKFDEIKALLKKEVS